MTFWIEWALAVHQAIWFPFNWATGLERHSVVLPVEYAPAMMGVVKVPRVIVGRAARSAKTAK